MNKFTFKLSRRRCRFRFETNVFVVETAILILLHSHKQVLCLNKRRTKNIALLLLNIENLSKIESKIQQSERREFDLEMMTTEKTTMKAVGGEE